MIACFVIASPTYSLAEDTPWARATEPSLGHAQSIGGYSRGCVAGAKALPTKLKGLVIAKPDKGRHFGHPALIDFITSLAQNLSKRALGGVVTGDLSQPRGGPTPSGHASHQTGLDADVWFTWPGSRNGQLSKRARRRLAQGPKAIVEGDRGKKTPEFTPRIRKLLKLATEDSRVARIFVHPGIKRDLCRRTPPAKRGWLRKIRPWWGHRAHFHVRLHCPEGSKLCVPQSKLPPGPGCDLSWWFRADLQKSRKTGRAKYRKGIGTAPALPEACQTVEPKRR